MAGRHMSSVHAVAVVNGMEAIVETIKAHEREGVDRMNCLTEARDQLLEFLNALNHAITAESGAITRAAQPAVTTDDLHAALRSIVGRNHQNERT